MTEDRVGGRRVEGNRRPRSRWLLALGAALALASAGLATASAGAAQRTHRRSDPLAKVARRSPFGGRGMWIWILSSSNGGNLHSIIATAHKYGIRTVLIKSGDGSSTWSQFNPQVVSTLHAGGLRVCAWQYVYGSHPISEAYVGAAAVHDHADCLVIDAESEYEGKYVQAQGYISQLRKLIGKGFPVALAGFPYMDYHPAFPYSVFLGPGGAQYNVPQMYWYDIGTSVDAVYTHTYMFNRLYKRTNFPLGQLFQNPPERQIVRFRQLSRAYGATGLSWWDWQEGRLSSWHALARPIGSLPKSVANQSLATIGRGWQGDVVVWAQEHLLSAGFKIKIDGGFGSQTQSAVKGFQSAHGLPADGVIGPSTWQALLRYRPAAVRWTTSGAVAARAAGGSTVMPVPASARLPAKRDEIPGTLGAGRPAG